MHSPLDPLLQLPVGDDLPPRICAALALLLQVADYASARHVPLWDCAVEVSQLHAVGLTNNGLRWLADRGWVELAAEGPARGKHRTFRRGPGLRITDLTCAVLTEAGRAAARALPAGPGNGTAGPERVPHYDRDRRELRLGDQVVKRFRQPAGNQELILLAFEEQDWPPRIDDPLPPEPGQDRKERLRDTVKALNRRQILPLVHFATDGSGEGVLGKLVPVFAG
jgi:hypothetical protein